MKKNLGTQKTKTSSSKVKVQKPAAKATQVNKNTMGKSVKNIVPLKGNVTGNGKVHSKTTNNGASVNGKANAKVGAMASRAKTIIRQKAKVTGKAIPVKGKKSVSLALGKK